MLAAFKVSTTLVPFEHIARADSFGTTGLSLYTQSYSSSYSIYFRTREERDKQFANFVEWLTIKTNSI